MATRTGACPDFAVAPWEAAASSRLCQSLAWTSWSTSA